MSYEQSISSRSISFSQILELGKPRIMLMALFASATGLVLAPGTPDFLTGMGLLLGTALLVGSANTLNMYLEREIDCLMVRTSKRPLPTRRLHPDMALTIGVIEACLAVPILTFWLNPLTGFLGVVAFLAYVNLYTPLKQRTSWAVLVGAIPGAMPALMGWTAVTNGLEPGGLAIFSFLMVWQIPHFHAIALFRVEDYNAAGLKTLPGERGDLRTRWSIVGYLALQLMVSLTIFATGVAGNIFLVGAILIGGAFLAYGVMGFFAKDVKRWARKVFIYSIIYLPLLYIILLLDGKQ